jgi:hypothetical protein
VGRGLHERVLGWLLGWTAVTLVLVWLPLVRAVLDGASYQWGLAPGLSGAGVDRGYPLLVLVWAVGVGALWTGWRGPTLAARVLLPLWQLPVAVVGLWLAVGSSDGLIVRGDTLGLSLDVSWAAPVVLVPPFLAAAWWALHDDPGRHRRSGRGWSRWNRRCAVAALALVPVQALLLRAGEPHGTTDQAGVLLTIAQWWLVVATIKPPAHGGASDPAACGQPGQRDETVA